MLAMVVNNDACYLNERGALASIASRLAPTEECVILDLEYDPKPVGASLLAMVVNDDACSLNERGALESISSKPGPDRIRRCTESPGR